jgi:two-component system, chemotaxis family, chemotaxis protein CheY
MSDVLNGKVLVVDDMKTMVRILKKFLEEIGFTDIDVASNGVEALELIQNEDYTLIISDWNMEPMTGLELLKEVRADPRTEKTPFLMVTAESKPNNVLAAQAAGVSNYIVKPFTQVTIRKKIDSVIGPLD